MVMVNVWPLLDNCSGGKYQDKDFLIVDSWVTVEKVMGYALENICPEEVVKKYYGQNRRDHEGNLIIECGDLAVVDGRVPPEVEEAFKNAGYTETSFEAVIGMEYGFADECALCSGCGQTVLHLYPDFVGQKPDYLRMPDGERLCQDCVAEEALILFCKSLHNQPIRAANTRFLDHQTLVELGYELVGEHRVGYAGDLTSTEIYNRTKQQKPGTYLFVIEEESLAETKVSLWRLQEVCSANQ